MSRALVSAAGFAVAGGVAADAADLIFVSRLPDQFGRLLLAAVEPLDATPHARELAGIALRVMRETFAATPGAGGAALLAAFAAANAAILEENHALAEVQPRRLCVGATGIAISGRDIVVAQSPPTQALLVQDGQAYAFPDAASWRGDYAPAEPEAEAFPLGFTEQNPPRLFQSQAAPGDVIALCATTIGRALAKNDDAIAALYGGSLVTGDLEGSVDRLERLLGENHVGDAFAVVAIIERLGRRAARLPAPPARQARSASPLEPAVPRPVDNVHPRRPPTHADPLATDSRPRFEGVRDVAIALGEFATMPRRVPAAPSHEARRRALAAPGATSVQRYREPGGLPAELRANLPRGPGLPFSTRMLAISFIILLSIGGTGIAVGRQRDREVHAAAELAQVDASLRDAAENPGMAMSAIADAEAALQEAAAFGADKDTVADRERLLGQVRDRVWHVERLVDVERVGALPTDVSGGVHLAISGKTLYIAAGDLYELAPDENRLTLLLARGDEVPGGAVGDLRHVSVDGGRVVASDGRAIFRRDDLGTWQSLPLAIDDVGGLKDGAPIVTWGDASYSISWEGDIVRFEQGSAGPQASIWADADSLPDLTTARDLFIDGRILVLVEGGRTLVFSRGEQIGEANPFVMPLLTDAAFLADAPFANDLYLVDHEGKVGLNAGRIIRVGATGDAEQLVPPSPAANDLLAQAAAQSLAHADDVAIDELSGSVYWIASGEIWKARLPVS
ncbi:MAG: hypothetical protein U0031_21795 [Thermomicrobiales bacterium]